jgi:hypothetical protein
MLTAPAGETGRGIRAVLAQGLSGQRIRGYRLTAVGGSDNHDADLTGQRSIGYPTTVVHASALSTAAVLEGLRAGHAFIDTKGTKDRMLEYSATVGGQTVAMGDAVTILAEAPIRLSIHVANAEGAHLELSSDGVKLPLGQNAAIRSDDHNTTVDLTGNGGRRWIRLDVCTPAGHRLLLGNPIYISH